MRSRNAEKWAKALADAIQKPCCSNIREKTNRGFWHRKKTGVSDQTVTGRLQKPHAAAHNNAVAPNDDWLLHPVKGLIQAIFAFKVVICAAHSIRIAFTGLTLSDVFNITPGAKGALTFTRE